MIVVGHIDNQKKKKNMIQFLNRLHYLINVCQIFFSIFLSRRKRVIRAHSTEDDVHLVHRELDVGKQTKSVQVANQTNSKEIV